MKIKWFLCIITFFTASHSLGATSAQRLNCQQELKVVSQDGPENKLLAPILFTTSGITDFIEQSLNRPSYVQEVLPHDFRHLLQFLYHGQKGASKAYAKSVLKLFGNKLKGAQYVNAYAFNAILESLGSLLEPYVSPTELLFFENAKKTMHDTLYSSFLSQFDTFKKNPDFFFESMVTTVIDQLKTAYEQDRRVTHEHVQQAAFRFLDTGISKLIWNSHEHEQIWPCIKGIAQHLENFARKDILADADALDDLYWSLIHRFNFFLDVAATDLPICFYESVKKDIHSSPLLLCDLQEQEEHLETKKERLICALWAGEAKARMNA